MKWQPHPFRSCSACTQPYVLVMHQYEILPIIQLADIEIHIIASTDSRSDVIFTKIPHVLDKLVILKTLFWF